MQHDDVSDWRRYNSGGIHLKYNYNLYILGCLEHH